MGIVLGFRLIRRGSGTPHWRQFAQLLGTMFGGAGSCISSVSRVSVVPFTCDVVGVMILRLRPKQVESRLPGRSDAVSLAGCDAAGDVAGGPGSVPSVESADRILRITVMSGPGKLNPSLVRTASRTVEYISESRAFANGAPGTVEATHSIRFGQTIGTLFRTSQRVRFPSGDISAGVLEKASQTKP